MTRQHTESGGSLRVARAVCVALVAACATLLVWPTHTARAVGGSGESTTDQIDKATQQCQAAIASKAAVYAKAAAQAINECLDAIVRCDQQATDAKALTCRRALLVANTGKCADGKLDDGASMLGNGVAAAAQASTSKAALTKAMQAYVKALQKKCFPPDVIGVDLTSVSQGLGFSSTPATATDLADLTNQVPRGAQCQATALVLQTHPLANDIANVLKPLGGTCVKVGTGGTLGAACTLDSQCGATGGKCGQAAYAIREVKPCPVLLATGQTTSLAPGDDGAVQAGVVLSYVDNHDGTISDVNTGLMWEKKVMWDGTQDAANLHDADNGYPWAGDCSSETTCRNGGTCCQTSADCVSPHTCTISDFQGTNLTIFGWVARLNNRCADQTTDCTAAGDSACTGVGNGECGFAGYRDWRIPNMRELGKHFRLRCRLS
jgi:hypothetical protein